MRLGAKDDRDGWSPEQAVGLDVPARLRQHGMTSRGERREIRDGRAGDKRTAAFDRQPQDIEEPQKGDFFAAGREPPITNPKKRGPAIAIVAGDPMSSSS
jgi:hypothetical protein